MNKRPEACDLKGRTVHVIGMSRGGTTYLYHNLQRHPQIFVPWKKEVCYFGHNFDRDLDWFLDFYKGIGSDQVALDICGLYFMVTESIDRILEFNPDAKFLLTVRDPFEWIFSTYGHYKAVWDVPPFEEFVQGCVWHRDDRDVPLEYANGKVERTIRDFQERLGSNLLVMDFSLFRSDPLRMLKAVEQFLGLRSWFEEKNFSKARVNHRAHQNVGMMQKVARFAGISTLARLMPLKLVMFARTLLESERTGTKQDAEGKTDDYTDQQRSYIEEQLGSDRQFVQQLFADSPLLVGNRPYVTTA